MRLPFSPRHARRALLRACAALGSPISWGVISRREFVATIPAFLGVAASLPARATPEESLATLGARVIDLESAPLDGRSYRALIFPNGLRCLLASDPSASKAAAAMDVHVGYMSDPPELPGLAHFCEHMLFLGTTAYPTEGDFETFVTSAGGSNNAYTAAEETCYYFDVRAEELEGALRRFSQFFQTPLFTESATAREVDAIDSEHQKNLQSDFWRLDQLLKLRANPSHPYAKFGTGTRETLRGGDAAARAALLAFHERYYQAGQMELVVVGPQRLAELQALAQKLFAAVPGAVRPAASEAYDSLPLPFDAREGKPRLTLMVPVAEQRAFKATWCLPVQDVDEWARTKPEEVWFQLLRNRAKGGLLARLRKLGLANSVEPGLEEQTRAFTLLSVSIDLTEKGLTQWREVGGILFGYLRMLRDGGVPSHVYDEAVAMSEITFKFAEPSSPESFATNFAGQLSFYPPEAWVSGPSLMQPGARRGVEFILQHTAEPESALLTLVGKEFAPQAKEREPIYGTPYGTLPLEKEVAAWQRSDTTGLQPPSPNAFIPTRFALKCDSPPAGQPAARGAVEPALIRRAEGVRLHFVQDCAFRRPKGHAYFLLRSPQFYDSASSAVLGQLFQALASEALVDSTYQAAVAGLGAGVSLSTRGLIVSASGFDQRLPELVGLVAAELRRFPLDKDVFARRLDVLRQGLQNFKLRQPVSLTSYYRGLVLERPKYTVEELSSACAALTLADLQRFQSGLLAEASAEGLVCGNFDEADALAMLGKLQQALPGRPLPDDASAARAVRKLPAGRALVQQFVASNPDEANSALEVYFQVGPDRGDDWLQLALLSQIVEQPFFGELRTKQQLGYIVQSGVTETEGVRGLSFLVQSTKEPPAQVERRVDRFLADFRASLASLPEAELQSYREALASQALDVDKRLGQQASRFWGEISQRRYDFGRPWRTAKRVRKVQREELLAFFDRFVAPGAPELRRLSTHVFAIRAAPKTLEDPSSALEDVYWPASPDQIDVVRGARQEA